MSRLVPIKKTRRGEKLFTNWNRMIDLWISAQVGLPKVARWNKYRKDGKGRVHHQDALQHSYSIVLLGHLFLELLEPYVQLDGRLLTCALVVHDLGEAELKQAADRHYIDKTDDHDLNEYRAFVPTLRGLPVRVASSLHRAYLLQYAGRNPECFPASARAIMRELATDRPNEVLAFEAVERWDYVLYALEQEQQLGNMEILVQVARHQVPHLNRLALCLPGFGREIWDKEAQKWFRSLLEAYAGQWIEQKGET